MLPIIMLNLVNFARNSGDAQHELGLFRAWRDAGYSVRILTSWPISDDVDESVQNAVTQTPSAARLRIPRSFDTLLQARPLLKLISRERAALVYSRVNALTVAIVYLCRVFDVDIILEHNSWLPLERRNRKGSRLVAAIEGFLQIRAARAATLNICVTQGLNEHLITRGVDRQRTVFIGNGTDTGKFFPIPRTVALAQFGLDWKRRYIGIIGTIRDCHRVDIAVQAFLTLRSQFPDTQFVIFGPIDKRSRIAELLASIGEVADVTTIGPVAGHDANAAINCLDVALCPLSLTFDGAFGFSSIKLRDYAAAGRRILAGRVPGTEEYAECSWIRLHDPDDEAELREGMAELLGQITIEDGPSDDARRFALEYFDWRLIAARILAAYRKLGTPDNNHRT